MKCLNNMERFVGTPDMVMNLISLYESKGKDFYYQDVCKRDLEQVKQNTSAKDTYFFITLSNLKITEPRLKQLIKKDLVPKNKEEQYVINVHNTFKLLQRRAHDFESRPNAIQDMLSFLYNDIKRIKFKTEQLSRNFVNDQSDSVNKRENLEELLNLFNKKSESNQFELLNLITNLFIDFINNDYFEITDIDNTLILYIYLYKHGFDCFLFESFFEKLYLNKDKFDNAITQANFDYDSGYAQTQPLLRLIINFMLESYTNIESFVKDYLFDKNLKKTDNIENTILKMPELFTKDDIRNKHPFSSDSTITRTLNRLKDEGLVKPLGTGRSAKWIRLVESQVKATKVFEQLNIFDLNDFYQKENKD